MQWAHTENKGKKTEGRFFCLWVCFLISNLARTKWGEKVIANVLIDKITKHEVHYLIDANPQLHVIGTRTHNFFRCKFQVYKDEVLQYSMLQKSLLKQVISKIPGAFLFYENPFTFYRDGKVCGTSKLHTKFTEIGKWDFYLEDTKYTVTMHPKHTHTLEKDGVVVATYHRLNQEFQIYFQVDYSDEMSNQLDAILLFGAFVESYINMDHGTKLGSV